VNALEVKKKFRRAGIEIEDAWKKKVSGRAGPLTNTTEGKLK
jgi:hypothetical protein